MSRKMPPDRERYSAGGGDGSRLMMLTCSTDPTVPASISSLIFWNDGSCRRLNPMLRCTPCCSAALTPSRAVSTFRSMGFSQKMALPATAADLIKSVCVSVGLAMTTAVTSSSFSASLAEATRAPQVDASRTADCSSTSIT